MLHKATLGLVMVCLALAAPARAHFIWLDVVPAADGACEARLYFSEQPAPGEAHLVGKVAQTKVWLRGVSGDSSPLALSAAPGDDLAALVAPCPPADAASLEAVCDYGVYERGPGILLHYYAKRLTGDWTRHPALARAERLKLDIAPHLLAGKLAVDVRYDGKPAAGAKLVVVDPAGDQRELQTDAQGRAEIAARGGRWALRAAHIEADRGGEKDGKKYAQTWHYCTLLVDVPTGKSVAEISAADALERARAGRAVWKDFPGLAADLTLRGGDKEVTGKVEIDADGIVSFEAPESPLAEWAEEQLNSLVQHRMPEGEVSTGNVTWVDENDDHPLGRKIRLDDTELASAYRLKDDVIMEVNRWMGPIRFTISVLEIERNPEGKYLPRSFAMNFFDAKSGELKNSLAYRNQWQRVGNFDVPQRILEIDAKKGGSSTKEIVFENCRLLQE